MLVNQEPAFADYVVIEVPFAPTAPSPPIWAFAVAPPSRSSLMVKSSPTSPVPPDEAPSTTCCSAAFSRRNPSLAQAPAPRPSFQELEPLKDNARICLAPLLAYIAGIVTVLKPLCPAYLAHHLGNRAARRSASHFLALGLSVTFSVVFVLVSLFGGILEFGRNFVRRRRRLTIVCAWGCLGCPQRASADQWRHRMVAGRRQPSFGQVKFGISGQFVVGAICIACPLYLSNTGAASLSLSATNVGVVLIIALMFSTGVSTVVLALSYGSRQLISARR